MEGIIVFEIIFQQYHLRKKGRPQKQAEGAWVSTMSYIQYFPSPLQAGSFPCLPLYGYGNHQQAGYTTKGCLAAQRN